MKIRIIEQKSKQQIIFFYLKCIDQFAFNLYACKIRISTEALQTAHLMAYSTLQLILPPQTYLPVSITSIISLNWQTAVQLFVKHFNLKTTHFAALGLRTLHEFRNISKAFSEVDKHIMLEARNLIENLILCFDYLYSSQTN